MTFYQTIPHASNFTILSPHVMQIVFFFLNNLNPFPTTVSPTPPFNISKFMVKVCLVFFTPPPTIFPPENYFSPLPERVWPPSLRPRSPCETCCPPSVTLPAGCAASRTSCPSSFARTTCCLRGPRLLQQPPLLVASSRFAVRRGGRWGGGLSGFC